MDGRADPPKLLKNYYLKEVNNDHDGGWEIEHEKKRIFSNYVNLQTSNSISVSFNNRIERKLFALKVYYLDVCI